MSHVALQRVMVRMLYDQDLVDRVLSNAEAALAGVNLTPAEYGFLSAPDVRAWKVDPERAVRSLNVLVQQYPTSSALVARDAGGAAPLLAYFRSPAFHRCMQAGESMAVVFGDELVRRAGAGEFTDPRIAPLAGFERAVVRLHRSIPPFPPRTGPGDRYRRSPDTALHRAPSGTADVRDAVHADLLAPGTHLALAVVDPAVPVSTASIAGGAEEALLLELVRDDGPRIRYRVGAAEITEGFYGILEFASTERTRGELETEIVRLGADAGEAGELIGGMIAEGTLVPV